MNRKNVILYLFALALVPTRLASADKPNFIIILADDQGWNALSTRMNPQQPGSGSTYYRTPRLSALAAEGMRFSHAYAPAPTCSPTRHALQFGRSPTSLKIFGADGIRNWDANHNESLANVLKQVDSSYVCAHLGKWHIGGSPASLGFDVSDGPTGNSTGNSKDRNDPKKIFDLSERSSAFIEEQTKRNRPFLLQISHYANHLKYQARVATVRKYETEHASLATPYQNSPLWAAMNEDLDTGIGIVLDKIKALGIEDTTYIFYTADNGYELKRDSGKPVDERGYYKAYPQRSHKYHVSEGGIRVPFLVRGPGIPPGIHSDTPVVGTDIFTTIIDLAGGQNQLPQRVEGASLVQHLKSGGKQVLQREDDFLVFKYSKPRAPHDIAIVQGKYKLIRDIDADKTFLFDLHQDIGERNNLLEQQPERAAKMYAALTAYFARFGWDESQIETQKIKRKKATSNKAKRPAAPTHNTQGWLKPFNGNNLDDWDGAEGYWRVVDNTIVGETTTERSLPNHSYLIWRGGNVQDFELRLKFRISGKQGNSGVQYRSRDLGMHRVAGYQYNIHANRAGATGVLEEMHNGRGGHLVEVGQQVRLLTGDVRKLVGSTGNATDINSSLKKRWWNTLTIRAEGKRLQHWLNGYLAIDAVDEDPQKSATQGVLAFQLHAGAPMKIELKDIRLLQLATDD